MNRSGFPLSVLIPAVLLGAGAGFAFADCIASSSGYRWDSPKYIAFSIAALFLGVALGISVGWKLERVAADRQARYEWQYMLWVLLVLSIITFTLLQPVLEGVRE